MAPSPPITTLALLALLAAPAVMVATMAAPAAALPTPAEQLPTPAELVAAAPPAAPLPPRLAAKHEAARRRTIGLLASLDARARRDGGADAPAFASLAEAEEAAAAVRRARLLPPTSPAASAAHYGLPGLGRKKKRKQGGRGEAAAVDCEDPAYRNIVMSTLVEGFFLGLFKDLRGQTKLEASGMDVVGDDIWVIFDNTPLVGLVDLQLTYADEDNALIPPVAGQRAGAKLGLGAAATIGAGNGTSPGVLRRLLRRQTTGAAAGLRGPEDSQFEGISAISSRPGQFLIVEETRQISAAPPRPADNGGDNGDPAPPPPAPPAPVFHPFAQRVELSRDRPEGYRVLERCAIHIDLVSANKGVEGISYIEDARGRGYLMASCEGNYCEGGRRGRERGHGKIVVLEFDPGTGSPGGDPDADDDGRAHCGWRAVKTLDMPRAAAFTDYSDIAFADPGFTPVAGGTGPYKGAVVILSQEDSALWIGLFDYNAMDFDPDVPGATFILPRSNACDKIYCNAEGVAWLDATRLVVATDRAKSTQPFQCVAKDEAMSVFALPDGAAELIAGGDLDAEEEGAGEDAVV